MPDDSSAGAYKPTRSRLQNCTENLCAIQWKVSRVRVRPCRILLPSESARNVWNSLEPSALGKMQPVSGDLSENFIAA